LVRGVMTGKPANGDQWQATGRRTDIGCLACHTTGLMTKRLAEDTVEASQGVLEVYPCPARKGWHLRTKTTLRPGKAEEPGGSGPGA
jgi:hypothetical protein